MRFTSIIAATLTGLTTIASAQDQNVHVVSVGSTDEAKALAFSPNSITANQGDMIQFQFRAGNHTVTQSTFDQPCMPINMFTNNTGVYSGFMDVSASAAMGQIPVYTISVQNTNPMWFYCSQGRHCQNGMVMVVNENTAANSTRSLDNFVQLAESAAANLPGDATSIEEGIVGTVPSDETDTDLGSDDLPADGIISTAPGLIVPSTVLAFGAAAVAAFLA